MKIQPAKRPESMRTLAGMKEVAWWGKQNVPVFNSFLAVGLD